MGFHAQVLLNQLCQFGGARMPVLGFGVKEMHFILAAGFQLGECVGLGREMRKKLVVVS